MAVKTLAVVLVTVKTLVVVLVAAKVLAVVLEAPLDSCHPIETLSYPLKTLHQQACPRYYPQLSQHPST